MAGIDHAGDVHPSACRCVMCDPPRACIVDPSIVADYGAVRTGTGVTWVIGNPPGEPQPEFVQPALSDADVDRIADRVTEKLRRAWEPSVVTCHRAGCDRPATHLVDGPRAIITHKMCLACASTYNDVTVREMP
jgi:hypothetical protein